CPLRVRVVAGAPVRTRASRRPREQPGYRSANQLFQGRREDMTRILVFFLIVTMGSTAALAGTPAARAEAEKIQAALKAWGCSGGKMETEATGVFEVDDAKCPGGQYDIKLDKNFRVISITSD